jgi:hypothetical protein
MKKLAYAHCWTDKILPSSNSWTKISVFAFMDKTQCNVKEEIKFQTYKTKQKSVLLYMKEIRKKSFCIYEQQKSHNCITDKYLSGRSRSKPVLNTRPQSARVRSSVCYEGNDGVVSTLQTMIVVIRTTCKRVV